MSTKNFSEISYFDSCKQQVDFFKQSTDNRSRGGIVSLCTALVLPHPYHCMQVWLPQYKKDIKLLENIQRKSSKRMV